MFVCVRVCVCVCVCKGFKKKTMDVPKFFLKGRQIKFLKLLYIYIYIYICGDRSINGPIGFRIGSGLLGPWPIRGRVPVRGHHAPRQYASEGDRVRGQSGCGPTAIRFPS